MNSVSDHVRYRNIFQIALRQHGEDQFSERFRKGKGAVVKCFSWCVSLIHNTISLLFVVCHWFTTPLACYLLHHYLGHLFAKCSFKLRHFFFFFKSMTESDWFWVVGVENEVKRCVPSARRDWLIESVTQRSASREPRAIHHSFCLTDALAPSLRHSLLCLRQSTGVQTIASSSSSSSSMLLYVHRETARTIKGRSPGRPPQS